MLINIIGVGSFIYLLSSYLGCSPNRRKAKPGFYPLGGCPYVQLTRDPSSLKLRY